MVHRLVHLDDVTQTTPFLLTGGVLLRRTQWSGASSPQTARSISSGRTVSIEFPDIWVADCDSWSISTPIGCFSVQGHRGSGMRIDPVVASAVTTGSGRPKIGAGRGEQLAGRGQLAGPRRIEVVGRRAERPPEFGEGNGYLPRGSPLPLVRKLRDSASTLGWKGDLGGSGDLESSGHQHDVP